MTVIIEKKEENLVKDRIQIKETFKDKFLFFDGAMGTMLQEAGLETGEFPESLNITKPEVLLNIHKNYLEAGANIISTNTFGTNRLKLEDSTYSVEEIITSAVNIAKKSIADFQNTNKFVALDIGPIGTLLSPLGTLSFKMLIISSKNKFKPE